MPSMLGLEVNDERIVAVSVDEQGRVLAQAQEAAGANPGASAIKVLEQIQGTTAALTPLGVAAINPESPTVAAVISELAPRYGGPFSRTGAVLSGTAAAAAEAWIGAARGVKDVVYFSVGQHTTGGVVRDGVPVTGARGRASSVAWLALNPVEREDYRKSGCLESEVAAAGIVRRLIWRIKAGDRSNVPDTVNGDLSALTVEHALAAARSGDGVSISVIRDTAKYLGMAAANLVVVADPEMLVLGGIMASAADLLLEPIRIEITRRLPRAMMEALRIETAALGADAASIGAARMVAAALR